MSLHTIAVATLGNLTIIREARVRKTLEIVFNRSRPTLSEMLALGFGRVVETDHILAAEFALKIDQADNIANFLLLLRVSHMPLTGRAEY